MNRRRHFACRSFDLTPYPNAKSFKFHCGLTLCSSSQAQCNCTSGIACNWKALEGAIEMAIATRAQRLKEWEQ